MTTSEKQEALQQRFRTYARLGKISSQTYEHLRNIIFSDDANQFDVTAEQLADELLKNNITMQDAYDILTLSNVNELKMVNGDPATDADIDRYNLYLRYLKGQPNDYLNKKDFAFEVFGYAWSHLNK